MELTPAELNKSILESRQHFDLGVPLTDEELELYGMLPDNVATAPRAEARPVLHDLDEGNFTGPVDAVAVAQEADGYNAQYAHYLRCQAIAALVAFTDGWKSLDEQVLKAYVRERRRENAEYRGDDPNRAFALRARQQAAEDFLEFIRVAVAEAVTTPKPVLKEK